MVESAARNLQDIRQIQVQVVDGMGRATRFASNSSINLLSHNGGLPMPAMNGIVFVAGGVYFGSSIWGHVDHGASHDIFRETVATIEYLRSYF